MRFRSPTPGSLAAAVLGTTLLAATGLPVHAQYHPQPGTCPYPALPYPPQSCPAPPGPLPLQPAPAVPPAPPTGRPPERPSQERRPEERRPEERPPEQQPPEQQQPEQNAPSADTGQGLAGAGGELASTSNVLGDQLGLPPIIFLPQARGRAPIPVAVPSVRSFKIAEDESARPQDRVYFDFNYFNNVNRSVNERLGSPFHNIEVYRETFGLEKTFLNGDASVGLRLPLNTVTAESTIDGLPGTDHTDIGDLSIIGKYVFWRDCSSGSLLSAGLAVTTPTGPDRFANSDVFFPVHTTVLTPYLGFYFRSDRWYTQGFVSIDVPVENKDVTIFHTDVQVGYVLYRNTCTDAFLTAILPHFEVHVNDPLNHRGAFNAADPVGTPDWVDLTTGVTFEFSKASTLAVGFVTPVTGPKPYDFEILAQLNYRFGPTRAGAQQAGGWQGP
jgi:hypothetical protein